VNLEPGEIKVLQTQAQESLVSMVYVHQYA